MTPTTLAPILSIALPGYRPLAVDLLGNAEAGFAQTTLHAPAPTFDALLREVQFEADLFVLQPSPESIVTALTQALAFCSYYGEGLLVADEAALQALLFVANAPQRALLNHVWAHLTIGTKGVIYFAKALQSGLPKHVTCADLDAAKLAAWRLQADRLKLRRGADAASYAHTEDTVSVWDAAKEEWDRTRATNPIQHWNLRLASGLLKCELTKFDTLSSRLPPGEVARLFTLNGKTVRETVTNRPLRQLLISVLADGHWRIQPTVRTAYQTALREAIAKLQSLRAGIPETTLPTALGATLRHYQKDGFDFLAHLSRIGRGGILADDMGLGKTLQTLTWLLWLKQQSTVQPSTNPSLVICPASVMHNWRREAEKFTPQLKVLVLASGPDRTAALTTLNQFDLVITNYALLRRDLASLSKHSFAAMILDEAQFIKNPGAQVTKAVKVLGQQAQHRLALTGTPLENRLLDLWSIVDFAAPDYLGNQAEFKAAYNSDDAASRKALSRQLRPLMLRRLKSQVAKDLPARIELRRDCELGSAQMAFYREELRRTRDEVFQAVNEKGIQQSKLHVLAALTRLRQICCHPRLVGNPAASGKTEQLFELVGSLLAEGKKVLVFSQFTRMLDLLQAECRQRGINTYLLTGETKDRQAVVDAFNAGQGVFLLSLRAAGTGLNLTTASEVILYDPWWNPAVEAQAIDRSHRIGQTRTVNAHRLIMRDTIEERIWNIQQDKSRTINSVLGEGGFTRSLTKTDLEYLFDGVDSGDCVTAANNPTIQPSINPVPESAPMIPRHESNRSGQRNTRAAHPVEAPAAAATTPPMPPWRRRTTAKLDTSTLPLWRAKYGEN